MRRTTTAIALGLSLVAYSTGCGPVDTGQEDTADDAGETDTMTDAGQGDSDMTDTADGGDGSNGTLLGGLSESQNEGGMNSMGGGSGSLEGYVVTAHRTSGEGRTSVTATEGETDAEGNYSVGVDLSAGAATDLLVRANKEGSGHGEVICSDTLQPGEELTVAPIDTESSVESDVYVRARVSGEWSSDSCPHCTTAQLRTMIDQKTAAAIDAASDYSSEVKETSKSAVAGMKAWAKGLKEQGEASESEIEAVLKAQTKARAELSAKLHDASSQQEAEQAREAYTKAVAEAYADNDIDSRERARASHSRAEAMQTFAANLSARAKARAMVHAEMRRAKQVRSAVESHVDSLAEAGQETKTKVEEAGDNLEADLKAALEASADAKTKVEEAWTNYEQTIRTEVMASLKAEMKAAGKSALDFQTMVADKVDKTVRSAKSTFASATDLSASVETSAAASSSVEAFAKLWSSLTAQSNVDTITGANATATGISESSARAALKVMAHLTAGAEANASNG